jgi:hypothetical protein
MGYNDLNSSKRHDWRTPHEVVDLARALLAPAGGAAALPLDCASAPDNPTRAACFYDGGANGDGLMMPWDRPWWCNPPFGRGLKAWAERAATAKAPGLFLAPARVDTAWWARIYETADLVAFWRGRMRFLTPMIGPLRRGQDRPDLPLDPCPFPVQIGVYAGPCDDAARFDFVRRAHTLLKPHCNGFASVAWESFIAGQRALELS